MNHLPLLPEVVIYSDGACSRNGKPGARASAAAVVIKDGEATAVGEYLGPATSQMAEITGAIIGLKEVREPSRITIYTDSQYLVNGATGKHERHVNNKYWDKLDELSKTHYVTYVWVRGHDGDFWNEIADSLAFSVLDHSKVHQDRLDAILDERIERSGGKMIHPAIPARNHRTKREIIRDSQL
jgi:ribonuclease HI